ncbi:hypothetical protein MFRU_008g02780 [Monilinia fructicola]|nr:hypothetical protein MFRU_008g02780 [Monilinia fructicola]
MLNKENESGWTPLTRAAKRWQWAIVEHLLGEDAWIDPKDRNYHRTPLVEAAINAHEATVELLLKDGAHTLSIDKKGQTPLMQASSKENGPIVKLSLQHDARQLMERGAEIDSWNYPFSNYLYFEALTGRKTALRWYFLKKGAKIDSKAADGGTPLFAAIHGGHKDVFKILLECRASIDCEDQDGVTPFLLAVKKAPVPIVELLLKYGSSIDMGGRAGRTPLSWAITSRDEFMIMALLRMDADMEFKDRDGYTTLNFAICDGGCESLPIIKSLLNHGADIESRTIQGGTPSSLAIAKRRGKDSVMLLLGMGADVHAKDEGGRTPSSLAVDEKNNDLVDLLMNKDSEIYSPCVALPVR